MGKLCGHLSAGEFSLNKMHSYGKGVTGKFAIVIEIRQVPVNVQPTALVT